MREELLHGWGRCPLLRTQLTEPANTEEITAILSQSSELIPMGLGRSYGDSALAQCVLKTHKLDRFISFDPVQGILECEAGVSLEDILKVFVPQGWFPPVTPGTRFVTVGGMLASDIHGKNHHKVGSFSNHVVGFALLTAEGEELWVTPEEKPELFLATAGGVGLTGIILRVRFMLQPIHSSFIRQTTLKLTCLEDLLESFEATASSTYSVAWIDCLARGRSLGRSLLMLGEHADPIELVDTVSDPLSLQLHQKAAVPFDFPCWALNSWSIQAFNTAYYQRIRKTEMQEILPLTNFFYPLDTVHNWNRIYGKRGFYQYQCVLPIQPTGAASLKRLLEKIAEAKTGSFLAVLKLFGPEDPPYLAFAMEGYTLALDFPANSETENLLIRLDQIVEDAGGRLYLTKDARMPRSMLQSGYPHLDKFLKIKHQVDPENRFTSLQAQRLGLVA